MRCEEHSHPETGSPLFLLGTEPVSLTVGKAREAAAFHIAWSKQQLPRGCLLLPVCGVEGCPCSAPAASEGFLAPAVCSAV